MSRAHYDPAADLAACQAMGEEFDAYLKSDVLYWQMSANRPGGSGLPKLTIGGFLERVRRLRAAPLTPQQSAIRDRAVHQFEQARDAHPASYTAHVLHDLRGRLDAWAWFLDDYAKQPKQEAPHYATQAHTRLALDLLRDELANNPEAVSLGGRLRTLDERLRGYWIDGPFIWPAELEHAFPREQFWWLYGELVGSV